MLVKNCWTLVTNGLVDAIRGQHLSPTWKKGDQLTEE